jgi:hypothetical protein
MSAFNPILAFVRSHSKNFLMPFLAVIAIFALLLLVGGVDFEMFTYREF